jgi:stage V sporulation protein SpoVS
VQAIKAVAIARQYLADDDTEAVDLIAQPVFDGDSAHCTINLRKANFIDLEQERSELTVSSESDPYKVAGAIAGKIRDGERVSVVAIGAQRCVFCADFYGVFS